MGLRKLSKEHHNPEIKYSGNQVEGCVVFLIIFTVIIGFFASNPPAVQFFPLTVALGLSAIAAAILHLAKIQQEFLQ